MNIHLYIHGHENEDLLEDVLEKLNLVLERTETIVSALDDLKSAIADLATALSDNNAEIEVLLTKIVASGTSDADVAAAVAQIRALISDNKAEVDKAKAAAPIAPPV